MLKALTLASTFLLSFSAFAQNPLCSQPLDSNWPQVTVIAPNLSQLLLPEESLDYTYAAVVRGPQGNIDSGLISSRMQNGSQIVLGGLNKTYDEGGSTYLKVTVTFSGNFKSGASSWQTQSFQFTQEYKVKTAGLCLDANPLKLIPIAVQLPAPGTFKKFYNLRMIVPSKDSHEEFLNLELKKALNTEKNQLQFRILGPRNPSTRIELFSISNEGKTAMAKLETASRADSDLNFTLNASDFKSK